MKTTIIFLGLVALSFTTANATNEFKAQELDQQEFTTTIVANLQTESQSTYVNQEISNILVENSGTETVIFSPDSVIKTNYVKNVEEVITENKLITEDQEEIAQPLSLENTLEYRIAEDNQIIESNISNEVYALDFNKINQAIKTVKVYNNATMTADLKL